MKYNPASVLAALIVSIAWMTPAQAENAPAVRPEFQRVSDLTIELDGPLQQQTDGVVRWLQRAPDDNPAMLEMFRVRDEEPRQDLLPWSGEFAGKYLTSGVEMLRLTGDAELRDRLTQFVRDLIDCQDENGYLGPFPKEDQLRGKGPNFPKGGTWDAWNHYHAMVGLLAWHQQGGDPEALRAAVRIGDLLCQTFFEQRKPVVSIGSAEMNQAIVHSLALLHQHTGDDKYLLAAESIVREFEMSGAGDYLNAALAGKEFYQTPKPRWESLHPIMGMAELYWITGKEEYRTAFEHHWWSIVEFDRHNNGGFSSGEQAQGNPYHPGAIETCCTIAWLAMSTEMLRMTGNSLIADELELSTLNQVVGLHAPDGDWCTYNTPMDGRRVPSTKDIAFQIRPGSEELNCCSVNAARGFGLISDWAVMRHEGGLALNWYGPSQFTVSVGDVPVAIKQVTEYPREGQIEIQIDPERSTQFELKLRIPRWSTETVVRVNGEPVAARAGSYLSIDRRWEPGDKIELELDMALRYWAGERECQDKASVYRGPLLLAYDRPPIQAAKFSDAWNRYGSFMATKEQGATATVEFQGDSIEWHGYYYENAGKALVTIDGEEVDVVDQYGPKREVAFVWKHDGLGGGHHVMTVKVLGEKNAASADTWMNIEALKAPGALPKFNVERLAEAKVLPPDDSGFLVMEVEDATGQLHTLRDYGSAGRNGTRYSTWLPIRNVQPTSFTRDNPSRTSTAAN